MNNVNNAAAKAAASKKKMMMAVVLVMFMCCVCCCISSMVSGGSLFFASKKKDEPTTSPSDPSPSDASPSDPSPSDASPSDPSPPAVSKQYAVLPNETTSVFHEGNKMWSLSGLDVTCRQSKKYPNVLSQFHLKRTASGFGSTGVSQNNIKYDYKCLAGVEKEHNITGFDIGTKYTNCDTHGDGNTVYLDRHHVDCGKSPIIEFRGNRCLSTDKYRYKYRCGNHKSESCRDVSTNFNDEGGGQVVYLDRHDVKCKEGEEYISKFKLSRNGQGKYRYDYTCCKP